MVAGFGQWPYGELPVLVATHRPLPSPPPTVRAVHGSITEIVGQAKAVAGGRDVYLDGGMLIRKALDAGLIDELIVSLIPVILGAGHPLFAGVEQRGTLELVEHAAFDGGLVQLRYRWPRLPKQP